MTLTVRKLIQNWPLVTLFVSLGSALAYGEIKLQSFETVIRKQAVVIEDISEIKGWMATNEEVGDIREQNINDAFSRIENQQNNMTDQINQLIILLVKRENDNPPIRPYGGR